MPDRAELERTFVEQIPTIERVVAALCRRYGVARDDVEDVASWVKTRIVEDDYAVLAKFRGESSIATYLTVVVASLFRDYRAQRWGRWRPSAAARRHGAVAVRLETLVIRDQLPLRQAGELLRTSGETSMSDAELARLVSGFPARGPLRPMEVGAEALALEAGRLGADADLDAESAGAERATIVRAIESAMAALPAEDRVILTLRFWEDVSVADIARTLSLPQKPLYRRIDRAVEELREQLTRSGISADALAFLSDEPAEAV